MVQSKDDSAEGMKNNNSSDSNMPQQEQDVFDLASSTDTTTTNDLTTSVSADSKTEGSSNADENAKVTEVIQEIKELNEMIPKAKSSDELVQILQEISKISNELSHIPAVQYYLSMAAVTYLEHRDKYSILNKKAANTSIEPENASNNIGGLSTDISGKSAITRQELQNMQKIIIEAKTSNAINCTLETALFKILSEAELATEGEISDSNQS